MADQISKAIQFTIEATISSVLFMALFSLPTLAILAIK
jgi:hypothetical protein